MTNYLEELCGSMSCEPPNEMVHTLWLDAHKLGGFEKEYEESQVRSFCRRWYRHRATC